MTDDMRGSDTYLELPIMPLREVVMFPRSIMPLFVGREASIKAIEAAQATMVAAAARPESRGAHAHDDFPNRDDANWMKHSLWYSEGNRLDYKPVNLQPLTVESVPPKVRTF